MNRLINYFTEAWAELGRVNWPKPKQALKLTVVVAVFSLVFAALIGALDYGFTTVLQKFILRK